MQSFQFDFLHFLSNCVVAIASQAVDTGPDKEVRANVMRRAEQLVDIAFPITNMHATLRVGEQLG